MHDTYIGGHSENNIKCILMTISGRRTEQLDIFCRVIGFTSDFSQFHSCGTYSVLSRSPSIALWNNNGTQIDNIMMIVMTQMIYFYHCEFISIEKTITINITEIPHTTKNIHWQVWVQQYLHNSVCISNSPNTNALWHCWLGSRNLGFFDDKSSVLFGFSVL